MAGTIPAVGPLYAMNASEGWTDPLGSSTVYNSVDFWNAGTSLKMPAVDSTMEVFPVPALDLRPGTMPDPILTLRAFNRMPSVSGLPMAMSLQFFQVGLPVTIEIDLSNVFVGHMDPSTDEQWLVLSFDLNNATNPGGNRDTVLANVDRIGIITDGIGTWSGGEIWVDDLRVGPASPQGGRQRATMVSTQRLKGERL